MANSKRTHAPHARTHSKSAPHTDPAAALIAAADKGMPSDPTPEALAALRKIFEHNDTRPRFGSCGRVSRIAAVKMLRESYGWAYGEPALEALCRRLGRRSWGAK